MRINILILPEQHPLVHDHDLLTCWLLPAVLVVLGPRCWAHLVVVRRPLLVRNKMLIKASWELLGVHSRVDGLGYLDKQTVPAEK